MVNSNKANLFDSLLAGVQDDSEPQLFTWTLKTLTDSNADVIDRQLAAEELGELGSNVASRPEVVSALLHVARTDEDDRVRVAAIEAIGAMGQAVTEYPDVSDLLAGCLDDTLWTLRIASARTVSRLMPHLPDASRFRPLLLQGLKDENADVRRSSIVGLAQWAREDDVQQELVRVRDQDSEAFVRAEAREFCKENPVLDFWKRVQANLSLREPDVTYDFSWNVAYDFSSDDASTSVVNEGEPEPSEQPFYWTILREPDEPYDLLRIETDAFDDWNGAIVQITMQDRSGEPNEVGYIALHPQADNTDWLVGILPIPSQFAELLFCSKVLSIEVGL